MSRWLIIVGIVLISVGLALQYAPWLLTWFGRLPGDIRIETEHTKIYIPLASMFLLSILLSLVIYLFRR